MDLHVTNGDATVARLRAAGVEGTIVPWRDVLHDGPLPAGLDEAALRETRARFLAGRGWGSYDAILVDMGARDAALDAAALADETTLWFEHDLYDQLQLVQLLDHFARHPAHTLTIVQADDYLGRLEPAEIRALWNRRRSVTPAQLALGTEAWAAVRADDPRAIEGLLARGTGALPFLAPALGRFLEELPGTRDGLSRTERQLLGAIAGGAATLGDAFVEATQRQEDALWLGDASVADYLERLSSGERPLATLADGKPIVAPKVAANGGEPPDAAAFWSQRAVLTPLGREVLAGQRDAVAERGIARWLGGVKMEGREVRWRWDGKRVVGG